MNELNDSYQYWAQFDSYVKKVAVIALRGYYRSQRKYKKEIPTEDVLIFTQMEQPRSVCYPSDRYQILWRGKMYSINDEELCTAMQSLPDKYVEILFLKYWFEYNERQISKELMISVRSAYTRRTQALSMLRRLMEGLHHEKAQ